MTFLKKSGRFVCYGFFYESHFVSALEGSSIQQEKNTAENCWKQCHVLKTAMEAGASEEKPSKD